MILQSSSKVKKGSKFAKGEGNDCVVLAIANAMGVDYDTAHTYARRQLNRKNGRGVRTVTIHSEFGKGNIKVGDREATFTQMKGLQIKNRYVVKGETIDRKKTLKSFIQSHPKGTYIVLVARHALVVKDGILIDHPGLEFKPTRKVQAAYEVSLKGSYQKQLTLF